MQQPDLVNNETDDFEEISKRYFGSMVPGFEMPQEERDELAFMIKSINTPLLKKYMLSLDLEASNNVDVAGIGAIVGSNDGVVHKRLQLFVREEELHFSTDCRTDFWEKDGKLSYDKVKKEKRRHKEQVQRFARFWDNAHINLPEEVNERQLGLVSDNPEFDYARLTPYLRKHCEREPVRYTTNGEYRPITDLTHVAWALGFNDIVSKAAKNIVEHNHLPASDAENIFISNIITERLIMSWKKKNLNKMRKFFKSEIGKITKELASNREGKCPEVDIEDA
jgi:hypothetical protein